MNKRIDPTGKRALFEAPVAAAPDQLRAEEPREGKAALFSTGPHRTGTVVVECSACRTRTRTSIVDVGVRLVSLSMFVPFRRYPHRLRCPACARWQWCRVGWNE
jgi:hypothetical protein